MDAFSITNRQPQSLPKIKTMLLRPPARINTLIVLPAVEIVKIMKAMCGGKKINLLVLTDHQQQFYLPVVAHSWCLPQIASEMKRMDEL